ncbi:GNAT family N-acetyltransferase [Yokenella regensburgei]|uniref:GNAT family N-acetyltransferase n=1 Tax=Yokenella regensburgei TaxID=158877 RepID=UPI003F184254
MNTHSALHTLCVHGYGEHVQTGRLTLRPVAPADLEDLFRIYGDPATNMFNPAGPYPDIAHARAVLTRWLHHWNKYAFGQWAIARIDAPENVIGFGGLSISTYADITINNLGYRFATEAWGNGLATEFSHAAVRYGFEVLNLNAISGVVRPDHLASQKVLTKAGFHHAGEVDDVADEEPSLLYTIKAHEWRASR